MSEDEDKETAEKVKAALKAKAAEVHPKGTEKDIRDKIEKKQGKK